MTDENGHDSWLMDEVRRRAGLPAPSDYPLPPPDLQRDLKEAASHWQGMGPVDSLAKLVHIKESGGIPRHYLDLGRRLLIWLRDHPQFFDAMPEGAERITSSMFEIRAESSIRGLLFDRLIQTLAERHRDRLFELERAVVEKPPGYGELTHFEVFGTQGSGLPAKYATLQRSRLVYQLLETYEKGFRLWLASILDAAEGRLQGRKKQLTLGAPYIGNDLRQRLSVYGPEFALLAPDAFRLFRNALAHQPNPAWNAESESLEIQLDWRNRPSQTLSMSLEELEVFATMIVNDVHPVSGTCAASVHYRLVRTRLEPEFAKAFAILREHHVELVNQLLEVIDRIEERHSPPLFQVAPPPTKGR